MANSENLRMLALDSLLEMQKNQVPCHIYIRNVLDAHAYLSAQERNFYRRLTEGTLEYRIQLDYVLDQFSKTKTRKMKPMIREILRLGAYQILYMNAVPDSAAVNESVKLAQKRGFAALKGFVNGVLRTVSRQKEQIQFPDQSRPAEYISVRYSLPLPLAEKWIREFGQERTELMAASFLEAAPFHARIRSNAPEETLRELEEAGIQAEKNEWLPYAYRLTNVSAIGETEAFRQGDLVVQDISSMLAVEAAGIKAGELVLDLCAAPGGKSMLAADKLRDAESEQVDERVKSEEIAQGPVSVSQQTESDKQQRASADQLAKGRVISRDLTENKAMLIEENILRCGIENIEIQVADATIPDPSMYGKADVVIADLPCSGLGVIRRKSDIKYYASQEKIDSLASLQREILVNATEYLKEGGILIYSTCTVAREENQENVKWILENLPVDKEDLRAYMPEALREEESLEEGYLQLLPGIHPCDGFFISRFRKR